MQHIHVYESDVTSVHLYASPDVASGTPHMVRPVAHLGSCCRREGGAVASQLKSGDPHVPLHTVWGGMQIHEVGLFGGISEKPSVHTKSHSLLPLTMGWAYGG